MKIIMEFVFFKVTLGDFVSKVEQSFELNEEKTLVSNHVVFLENFVNHVLQTNGIIYSSEGEAIKTNFIKVFHDFFSLIMTVFVIQAICMYEEL